MDNLVEKLSSYNLLNFLLPGAALAFLAPYIIGKEVLPDEVVGQIVISYFIGMIISRIGSLFLENVLKLLRILRPSDYREYVSACKVDSGIGVILETCNMYRTFAAGSVIALISSLFSKTVVLFSQEFWLITAVVLLLLWSFVKQYGYVSKRVTANRPVPAL